MLNGLYDERLYLSTTMLSRTKVGDISFFFFFFFSQMSVPQFAVRLGAQSES